MQLSIKLDVVTISYPVDGSQQRFDVSLVSFRLYDGGQAEAKEHFPVQGALIFLGLFLEFPVKFIRQILDGNTRHNEKNHIATILVVNEENLPDSCLSFDGWAGDLHVVFFGQRLGFDDVGFGIGDVEIDGFVEEFLEACG